METINIQETKTHLSWLIEQAAKGEPFVIAIADKPLVKVIPLNVPKSDQKRRVGFLAGHIIVPDDFDQMGSTEIERIFGGDK
ncbi:MAG: prevent-host-death protein [Desulfobacteraceae bacterium 4572_88]|nr:MAG: prevent-host-death protein [Desulfobacteraceae bacterium 4572_88]RLC12933.1 MAG: type II toxin-antitoxin system prevent-host-death family antitoxin [Deltaproteobacteria bacterium]